MSTMKPGVDLHSSNTDSNSPTFNVSTVSTSRDDWPVVELGPAAKLFICDSSVTFNSIGVAELTIGRSDEANVQINHRSISRTHGRLAWADSFILSDQDSSNGTWLNGMLIRDAVELKHGDQISFGDVKAIFTISGGETRNSTSVALYSIDMWFGYTMRSLEADDAIEVILVRLNDLVTTNREKGYETGDKQLRALLDAMQEASGVCTQLRGSELVCAVDLSVSNAQAILSALQDLRVDGVVVNWRASIINNDELSGARNRKAVAELIDTGFKLMPLTHPLPAPMDIGRASVRAKHTQFERVFAMHRALELDLKFFSSAMLAALRPVAADEVARVVARFGYNRGRTRPLTMGSWMGLLRELSKIGVVTPNPMQTIAGFVVSSSGKLSNAFKRLDTVRAERNEKVVHAASKAEGSYDDVEERAAQALQAHEDLFKQLKEWELVSPAGLRFNPKGEMSYDARLLHGSKHEFAMAQRTGINVPLINDWCYLTDGATVLPLFPSFFLATIQGRLELCVSDELAFDTTKENGRGILSDQPASKPLPVNAEFPELDAILG